MRTTHVLLFIVCTTLSFGQEFKRFEYAQQKMGTTFKIVFYSDDDSLAKMVADTAFAHIDRLNIIFSDYEPASEIRQLCENAWKSPVKVSDELWDVLSVSLDLSESTEGIFDISSGPLTKLWRRAIRRQEMPSTNLIEEAQALVGWQNIVLDSLNQSVHLMQPNMHIDLGGIAKGYTVDDVYRLIYSYGIKSVLVDGGGDIYVSDAPPGEEGWEIVVDDGNSQTQMTISDKAIASSGSTFKYVTHEGVEYSHIVNPVTGMGMTNPAVVTVSANSCMMADAMATTLCLDHEFSLDSALYGGYKIISK